MALVLEVRDGRGVPAWHRLEHLPLTLGRALSNDIIIDDPYADATHARVCLDEAGDIAIEDLGSVNGLLASGARTEGRLVVRAGTEIRMGRTTLRFRDVNEAVPSALVEAPRQSSRLHLLESKRGRLAVLAIALAATALNTWLGNTERSSGTGVLGAVLAAAAVMFVWSATWAVASRGADRRFHLMNHVTVISLAFLATLVYGVLNEWLTFFFPDSTVVSVAYSGVLLAALAVVIVGHLTVANALSPRGRWRAGLITSGTILAVIVLSVLVNDEKFSDVPTFPGQLKRAPASLVPTKTVDEFLVAMNEAKRKADEALEK